MQTKPVKFWSSTGKVDFFFLANAFTTELLLLRKKMTETWTQLLRFTNQPTWKSFGLLQFYSFGSILVFLFSFLSFFLCTTYTAFWALSNLNWCLEKGTALPKKTSSTTKLSTLHCKHPMSQTLQGIPQCSHSPYWKHWLHIWSIKHITTETYIRKSVLIWI